MTVLQKNPHQWSRNGEGISLIFLDFVVDFFFFFAGEEHFAGEETPSKHFQHETQAEHCKEEAADGAQRVKKKRWSKKKKKPRS